jgi:predicted ABC-type transport system involved in lysophospholipase L1 biosynthesis ATPase subunit
VRPKGEHDLRTTIGVDGIDALIEGGVPRGAAVLVAGEAGSGKSVLCMQFILAGIREGEPGVYAPSPPLNSNDSSPDGSMCASRFKAWRTLEVCR